MLNSEYKKLRTCNALWTGAAPRYSGSKLGCILTVPEKFLQEVRTSDQVLQ